jgi:hypothetical protein
VILKVLKKITLKNLKLLNKKSEVQLLRFDNTLKRSVLFFHVLNKLIEQIG